MSTKRLQDKNKFKQSQIRNKKCLIKSKYYKMKMKAFKQKSSLMIKHKTNGKICNIKKNKNKQQIMKAEILILSEKCDLKLISCIQSKM